MMAGAPLTILEHQTVPVGGDALGITWDELEQLSQLTAERPGFCKLGYRSVKFAQYAGLVRIGDRLLEILPKVEGSPNDVASSRNAFLCMLSLAGDADIYLGGDVAQGDRAQTLLDVFIRAFFDALTSLIRGGLLRRYRLVDDDLPVVRGRLNIERQTTVHAMRFDRVACQFDELTADNKWNRALRYALHVVRPWIGKGELERRWFELSVALSDISLVPMTSAEIDAYRFDRHVAGYRPAMQWAKWVIRQLSPSLRAGDNDACEMLVDMNRLFESAVATSIETRAEGGPYSVIRQDTTAFLATLLNGNGKLVNGLRPDMVIRKGGAAAAIADTKWTRVRADKEGYLVPDNAHMYQMLAYASAYRCDNLALIYPWHEGIAHAKPTSYALPQIDAHRPRVHLLCVDTPAEHIGLTWSSGAQAFLPPLS
jgi:5-methylcytosine-specific restriction enzyme subunit McrC